MRLFKAIIASIIILSGTAIQDIYGDNQTETLTPILTVHNLPFNVEIELEDFSLPVGLHSGVSAIYKGKWLFLAGRTNGLHGFAPDDNNFPPSLQNTDIYVVDPANKTVLFKSLSDPSSGLTQLQVDLLSVTSPQSYQTKKTLYIAGGYGVDTATGQFGTKPYLSAINIPGLIHWVENASSGETAAQHIKQIEDSIFQITGGYMAQTEDDHTLLIFGQNFTGFYHGSSNGDYSEQVRRFKIIDKGNTLSVEKKKAKPSAPNPNYRRRDLNIVPTIQMKDGNLHPGFMAFSGVFTPSGGAWTVPVRIFPNGHAVMKNANDPAAFKQGMNNYACPTLELFSQETQRMFTIFFGGISFGYFQDGLFKTDPELPFINQVTTVEVNKNGFTQYLMEGEYPFIPSTGPNPGNPLLFGAGAFFMPVNLPSYQNGVLKFDSLKKKPIVAGYIVGGIQSTLQNTNTMADSSACPLIFKVKLLPSTP